MTEVTKKLSDAHMTHPHTRNTHSPTTAHTPETRTAHAKHTHDKHTHTHTHIHTHETRTETHEARAIDTHIHMLYMDVTRVET